MKLTLFNKLSEFEVQILIYLSHVVVKDIVQAKINSKTYEGVINPEELLDLLKKFKIEIQNNVVTIDKVPYGSSNPGASSIYSYVQSNSNLSEYSKDDI